MQAAGTSILSLAKGVFASMRSACGGPGGLPLGSTTYFNFSRVCELERFQTAKVTFKIIGVGAIP